MLTEKVGGIIAFAKYVFFFLWGLGAWIKCIDPVLQEPREPSYKIPLCKLASKFNYVLKLHYCCSVKVSVWPSWQNL